MTPKEKAQELYNMYIYYTSGLNFENDAKQYALIAIDEILNEDLFILNLEDLLARKEYWEEVKKEINNL